MNTYEGKPTFVQICWRKEELLSLRERYSLIHASHFCYNASFGTPWVLFQPVQCAANKLAIGLNFGAVKSMSEYLGQLVWLSYCFVFCCVFVSLSFGLYLKSMV